MIIPVVLRRNFTGTRMDHCSWQKTAYKLAHILILEFVRDKKHLRELKPDFC